jgi:hypothetical protein
MSLNSNENVPFFLNSLKILITDQIFVFLIRKIVFYCCSIYLMYFGFFQNFDKVFAIAQESLIF